MIQSLARGLEILDLLANAENGIGITEFAQHLGVDKSSASRLLQTLASYGYAEQNADTRRYVLGTRVLALSNSVLRRIPLRDTAHPVLRQLTYMTGECSHIAILSQGKALYIDQVESPSILRVETEIGTLSPLHCTALGKVLIAFNQLGVPESLKAYTPKTMTDPVQLKLHMELVYRQGYAVDDEEHVLGVRCIAAPVFDHRGRVAGAVGISGPIGRMPNDGVPKFAGMVMELANDLSRRLGNTSAT